MNRLSWLYSISDFYLKGRVITVEEFMRSIFSLDGLGWGILLFIVLFFGSMWIWFADKRYSYEKVIVRKMDKIDFDNFKKQKKVELYYSNKNDFNASYYWIFGSEEKPVKIELLKFRKNAPKIKSGATAEQYEKKVFENVPINNRKKISLEPDEYAALNLTTTSGTTVPVFIAKLEADGRFHSYHIVSNMRYGHTGDERNILKFKQTFWNFIKDKLFQNFNQ